MNIFHGIDNIAFRNIAMMARYTDLLDVVWSGSLKLHEEIKRQGRSEADKTSEAAINAVIKNPEKLIPWFSRQCGRERAARLPGSRPSITEVIEHLKMVRDFEPRLGPC